MWLYLSLFVALWSAGQTTIIKRLSSSFTSQVLLFLSLLFTVPLLFITTFFLYGIPTVTPLFIIFLIISGALDTIAFICSFKAIKMSPISLIGPIGTVTPVFVTLFAFLFLHETPTLLKLLGIILIAIGAYSLNIKDIKHGFFVPFLKLTSNKGVQLAFFANLLWAVTPLFEKQSIFQTTPHAPLLASATNLLLVAIFISPFALKQSLKKTSDVFKYWRFFLVLAVFTVLSQLAAYIAFSQAYLGYVNAIFRLSSLFIIAGGWLFFKEKDIKERFLGASIMVIGTLLLAL